jgi:hypothetical protein
VEPFQFPIIRFKLIPYYITDYFYRKIFVRPVMYTYLIKRIILLMHSKLNVFYNSEEIKQFRFKFLQEIHGYLFSPTLLNITVT